MLFDTVRCKLCDHEFPFDNSRGQYAFTNEGTEEAPLYRYTILCPRCGRTFNVRFSGERPGQK